MQFFISYKSLLYADIESPFSLIGAFFMIFHVPRSISEQCSTVLISSGEQSSYPLGKKKRLRNPLFGGSGST